MTSYEKLSEQLDKLLEGSDWEVDSIQEHDLGSQILLEANLRIKINRDDYEGASNDRDYFEDENDI